jgi:HEAT repeat protein
MSDHEWTTFLRRWSEAILASPKGRDLPDAVRESRWLGFSPAADSEIDDVEARLGIVLPPSYRAFLKVSNGWRRTTCAIEHVRGTQDIGWFRKENRDWIAAYASAASFGPRDEISDDEYYAYGQQAAADFRTSHLKETLQVSDIGDSAVYLLNPQVIAKDGEWEAWFLANWLPGVHRYRSFLEMMQAEYHHFAGIEWEQPVGVVGELPDEYLGSPGSAKRHRRKMRRREPKVLGRRLRDWTVDELVAMLRQTDVPEFREEIAEILGRLGDQRAVDPLMAMLREESRACVGAISALKRLAPERLAEPLLHLIQERHAIAFNVAAAALAELRDERAIPILVEVLKDARLEARRLADFVSSDIAQFGQVGFDALLALLTSDEVLVRQRAAGGLLATNRAEARGVFRELLGDPDPGIRQMAEIALTILPRKQ